MLGKISQTTIRRVAIYALLGCLWIFVIHFALELFVRNSLPLMRIYMFIGIAFILLTSTLLLLLGSRCFRQLEASEQAMERFRSIFELAAIGVALVEPLTGRFVYINAKYCNITGYLIEDLLGNRFQDIIHPDDRQIYLDNTARLLAGGIRTFTAEVRYLHKNGSVVWVNLTISPHWLEGQEPNAQIAIVEDITARKMAEAALLLSEERYRKVVEDQTEIICRFKPDGTFTFVNDVYCRVFGKTGDELLGNTRYPDTFSDDVPIIKEQLRSLMPSNPVVVTENRVYFSTGAIRWLQFVNRGLFDKEGRLIEIQAVGRDITERKEAEIAFRMSDERLSLALTASKMGVWEWNVQTNTIIWSPECFEILGVERFNGKPESFSNILHPDDVNRIFDAVNRALTEKTDYAVEYRVIHSDGQVRWASNLARPTFDEKGIPLRLIGTVQDITERKRAEYALRESEEQLRRNLAVVRRLSMHMESIREDERIHIARNIHDELGQMLTALHFDLQWLKGRMPESATECFLKVQEMNRHVSATIESVQRISAELRPRLLDDLGLVPAMKWQTEEFEKRTGISSRFDSEGSMDHVTGIYATTIFRIFQEALTNVARHANATMVQVFFRDRGGRAFLEIIDNGNGITQEQLDSEQSFGLLGIRERVQMCGGEVEIAGQAGRGTTIKVLIPVSEKESHGNEHPHS